jgi:restriction endonuclease
MGSRAFYEGWDSNRPNVIAFINIGIGKAAKKFALQSIGRGVRIEPFKNMKRRLEGHEELRDWTVPIETLFVFGTNSISLGIILQTLSEVREREKSHRSSLEKKPQKPTQKHKEIGLPFRLHPDDKETVKEFLAFDDKVLVCMFDVNPKLLRKLKEEFDLIVEADPQERKVGIPEAVVKKVFRHFALSWNIPLCPC